MTKGGRLKSREPERGPRIGLRPDGGGSTQTERVRFSFLHFQSECIHNCTADQLHSFTEQLRKLSEMTWQQVTQAPKHGLGSEKIARAGLKCPLSSTFSPDVEFVLAFRYQGKLPMLGHREGSVLHVLWIDHNFSAYDHG